MLAFSRGLRKIENRSPANTALRYLLESGADPRHLLESLGKRQKETKIYTHVSRRVIRVLRPGGKFAVIEPLGGY